MSTIQEKAPLGSVGNPYEYSEYKRIFNLGNWTGGFVWTVKNKTAQYFKKGLPSTNGCGSGTGCGCNNGCGCGCNNGCGCGCNNGCGCGCNNGCGCGCDNGCGSGLNGCGSGLDGCGNDNSLGGNSGNGGGSDIIVHYDTDGNIKGGNNDCFFKCMEYAGGGEKNSPYSSEEYRYDYYCGYLNHDNWKGTGRMAEYLGGPYAMTPNASGDAHPNEAILTYLGCFFDTQRYMSIEDIRSLFPRDGKCTDGGTVIGFFRESDDSGSYSGHAVIIEKNNRGLLYIYDPQNKTYTLQNDANDKNSDRYKNSRFMYGFKLNQR